MSAPLFLFEGTFAEQLPELSESWRPASVPEPAWLALNEPLAAELGLDVDRLRSDEGLAVLAGNSVPAGANPIAQAYAGHQFGGYSPRLGDGRALLLGELTDPNGRRCDVQLKGSGRTPFARGGDGKAAVGPMLREFVVGEAMHALGVPTTRMLAVVSTGERVAREGPLPGAVLTRVAASHLRVGTFQYAAAHGGPPLVGRLLDHAIVRHHPGAAAADIPALAFLDAVVDAQAETVAAWMTLGFVHGVMNTDNTTISGETIDYGPCAFVDAYDPLAVYSSIDHGGRYAFGNQPSITVWNLSRLAETLLDLIDPDTDRAAELATDVLRSFADRFRERWESRMVAKLGLVGADAGDAALVADLLELMRVHEADHTGTFRSLADSLRRSATDDDPLARWFPDGAAEGWVERWHARLGDDREATADAMDRVNPVYIPRNHLVEEALAAATDGDLAPFHALVDVVRRPFDRGSADERYAEPAPPEFGRYRTFCGT